MDDNKLKDEIIKVLDEFGIKVFKGLFRHPNKNQYVDIDLMSKRMTSVKEMDNGMIMRTFKYYDYDYMVDDMYYLDN